MFPGFNLSDMKIFCVLWKQTENFDLLVGQNKTFENFSSEFSDT